MRTTLDSGGQDAVGQGDGQPIEFTIVIPTFNEQGNVIELLRRIEAALRDVVWEVIFVDDNSPDGTAEVARERARHDRRVRCIKRVGRRGLSSACIEGMMASAAPYVAVMDADLQHDERILPDMLQALRGGEFDIAVGSRFVEGGGVGTFSASRQQISRLATRLSRSVLRADLADPMSGFFAVRRDTVEAAVERLSGIGFKILLDLFASSPRPLRFKEIPFEFRERFSGESKLDSQVVWDYLMFLLDKLIGHIVPVRFISFSLVGGLGVGLHLLVLALLFKAGEVAFVTSQAIATLVAMTSNFLLNNFLTYRDRRLRGWSLLRGWLSFSIACSVGAVANVGIAAYLFEIHTPWLPSAVAGIVVSAVWNYAVTAVYTWNKS